MKSFGFDEHLIETIISATNAGFLMAGITPEPVGVSKLPARSQEISSVIGMVGKRTGTVSLNISPKAAIYLSKAFSGMEPDGLCEEVLDAVAEITNIIAGRLKAELGRANYGIDQISCPSIIIGGDYRVYHFQGFESASVEFSLNEMSTVMMLERYFSISVALSRK